MEGLQKRFASGCLLVWCWCLIPSDLETTSHRKGFSIYLVETHGHLLDKDLSTLALFFYFSAQFAEDLTLMKIDQIITERSKNCCASVAFSIVTCRLRAGTRPTTCDSDGEARTALFPGPALDEKCHVGVGGGELGRSGKGKKNGR